MGVGKIFETPHLQNICLIDSVIDVITAIRANQLQVVIATYRAMLEMHWRHFTQWPSGAQLNLAFPKCARCFFPMMRAHMGSAQTFPFLTARALCLLPTRRTERRHSTDELAPSIVCLINADRKACKRGDLVWMRGSRRLVCQSGKW